MGMFVKTKTISTTGVVVGVAIALGAGGIAMLAYPYLRGYVAPSSGCVISGCNSEFCGDSPSRSICVIRPEAACYQTAKCERQGNGRCGWTQSPELQSCLARYMPPPYTPPASPPCVVGGCRNEICSDQPARSICTAAPTDVCYQGATCTRQSDGKCGWTQSSELQSCLARYAPQPYTPPVPPIQGKIIDDVKPSPTPVQPCKQRGGCSTPGRKGIPGAVGG